MGCTSSKPAGEAAQARPRPWRCPAALPVPLQAGACRWRGDGPRSAAICSLPTVCRSAGHRGCRGRGALRHQVPQLDASAGNGAGQVAERELGCTFLPPPPPPATAGARHGARRHYATAQMSSLGARACCRSLLTCLPLMWPTPPRGAGCDDGLPPGQGAGARPVWHDPAGGAQVAEGHHLCLQVDRQAQVDVSGLAQPGCRDAKDLGSGPGSALQCGVAAPGWLLPPLLTMAPSQRSPAGCALPLWPAGARRTLTMCGARCRSCTTSRCGAVAVHGSRRPGNEWIWIARRSLLYLTLQRGFVSCCCLLVACPSLLLP